MKKISLFSIFLAVICLLSSSCTYYSSKPGKMSALVGTYRLTKYEVIPDAVSGDSSTDDERRQDRLEMYGIDAYLVVTDTGYGYYLYRENGGELSFYKVRLSYSYSTDEGEEDLISSISYETGASGARECPGGGKETFGFQSRKHTLNYSKTNTKIRIFGRETGSKEKVSVVYSRISKDTGLDTVQKKLGVALPPLPEYELQNLNGILRYNISEDYERYLPNPYIYYYVVFDNITMKGTVYYASREDYNGSFEGIGRTKEVTATLSDWKENHKAFTLDGKTYDLPFYPGWLPVTSVNIDHYYDLETGELLPNATEGFCFSEVLSVVYDYESTNLQELISADCEAYEQRLLWEQERQGE